MSITDDPADPAGDDLAADGADDDLDVTRPPRGWQAPGPGRPARSDALLVRAFMLSWGRWGDGGADPADRGIGSLRWVAQRLHEEGWTDRVHPTSTVHSWVRRGRDIRRKQVSWLIDPLENKEKIVNELHNLVGMAHEERVMNGEVSDATQAFIQLLAGNTGLLRLLADITGAKASTAVEVTSRMPAGMSASTVASLRATDPSALTDAEQAALRALYDQRAANSNGAGSTSGEAR